MDWFIYEWDSEGANQIEVEGKAYTISSPEDFWNYLVDVYKKVYKNGWLFIYYCRYFWFW